MENFWKKTMASKKRRLLLAWGYFGLLAILNGVGVLLYQQGQTAATPLHLLDFLFPGVLITFAFVGALIVSRQPKNRIGLLLFLPATSLASFMDGVVEMFSNGVWAVPNPPTPLFLILIWFTSWNWVLLIFPLLYLLILFPTGRLLTPRWRWLFYYLTAVMLTIPVLGMFGQPLAPASKEEWGFTNPIGFINPDWDTYFLPVFFVALPLGIILCIVALFLRFRRAQGVERAQMKWLFWAGGIFAATYIPSFLQQDFSEYSIWNAIWMLGMLTIPLSIGIAILRYHLFDIDLIINRALVYGGLTIFVIVIYVIVVGYLSFLFQTEANLGISLVATGLVAVLFGRLQNWLQRGVNRLMYGQRDEPYQLLTHLGQQLESAINPTSALSLTVETIAQALKLPYVAIGLQRGEEQQLTAVYGSSQNQITPFSLIYAGQPIGELLVAARAPNESLTLADQHLLADLARQIGMTAHAHLLNANLELARLRLVTERGEARRQLGSDLHDGVGHQLVSLTRQLERTRTITPEDPVSAQSQLAEINQQLMALTKQVRNLAHQLYPPELELLGLVGAIQECAHTIIGFQIRLDIQQNLPSFPAEIETAVYYIILEALTNIEKHAQAQTCTICLSLSVINHLELNIRDDGIGLPAKLDGGVGLLSMQARAAEVGGVCAVANDEGGGTAVTATIPCPIIIE
jgi:two-component system NarL family sensor kinase